MNFLDPDDKEFFYGNTVGPIKKVKKTITHDLKLKQKRVWIDTYDNQPISMSFVVLWIGKQLIVIREMDGQESALTVEFLMTNSIQAKKLRKK